MVNWYSTQMPRSINEERRLLQHTVFAQLEYTWKYLSQTPGTHYQLNMDEKI